MLRLEIDANHQSCSAGFATDGWGGRAEGADGGSTGAPLQGGSPSWALGFGRCGAGEANTCHLVDWSKQAVPGQALEVPERKTYSSKEQEECLYRFLCDWQILRFFRCLFLYLVPATAPSFLPSGSSSSTPHHSPFAKSVSPRNRTTPAFVPPTYKHNTGPKLVWFTVSFYKESALHGAPCLINVSTHPTILAEAFSQTVNTWDSSGKICATD